MKANAYAKRDSVLRELGFASYKAYLRSTLWEGIRRSVLEGATCTACRKRKATQVHHKRYDRNTLLGISTTRLLPICGGCHRNAEFTRYGKTKLSEANTRVKRFRRKAAKNECWENDRAYRVSWREKKALLSQPRTPAVMERIKAIRQLLNSKIYERKNTKPTEMAVSSPGQAEPDMRA